MKRTGSMRSRVGPAVTSTLRPASAPVAAADAARAGAAASTASTSSAGSSMRPGPVSPQAWSPTPGPEDRDASRANELDVCLRRRIGPHEPVHRRRDAEGGIGGETERREQVVGEAVREATDEVGRRGRDEDSIGPARELDVAHRRFGGLVPEVGAYRPARERLEGERRDELLRARAHHDLHFGAPLTQATHDFGALVRSDAARHAEQDAHRIC